MEITVTSSSKVMVAQTEAATAFNGGAVQIQDAATNDHQVDGS